MEALTFRPFPKIPRLSREAIITEKLDGTNAAVYIERADLVPFDGDAEYIEHEGTDYVVKAASRKRFITPDFDNFGFATWVSNNLGELVKLGPGIHFGEWWGSGIQRGYDLKEKRFSLFNVGRWTEENVPACCHVVPVLSRDIFDEATVEQEPDTTYYAETMVEYALRRLQKTGSVAAPGFMDPEGIMIYHVAANQYFKKTFDHDQEGKPES